MRPQGGRDGREPIVFEPALQPMDPKPSFACETARSIVAALFCVAIAVSLTAIISHCTGAPS